MNFPHFIFRFHMNNRSSGKHAQIKSKHTGFTLVELILYMSLLITLIIILGQVFSSILDVQLESKSTSSVELDGRFIIAKLVHDMRTMQITPSVNDIIVEPSSAGSTSGTLNFTVNSINYTYSLNNGNLQLVNDKGTNNLNSVNTIISDLRFTRIGQGTNTDTIRMNFALTSKIKSNSEPESRSYQTIISSQ